MELNPFSFLIPLLQSVNALCGHQIYASAMGGNHQYPIAGMNLEIMNRNSWQIVFQGKPELSAVNADINAQIRSQVEYHWILRIFSDDINRFIGQIRFY